MHHDEEFDAFVPFPEEETDEKTDDEEYLLKDLNDEQRAAVMHFRGPLMIVAAAGSGKTRVITRRIANLIAKGIKPWQILGVTFTNKAAEEMRKRVDNLVDAEGLILSTFHSFCLRVLRANGEAVDLNRDFVIFDRADQKASVKRVLKKLEFDPSIYKPLEIISEISRIKSKGYFLEDYISTRGSNLEVNKAEIIAGYQNFLKENNAVDFDDLLLLGLKVFSEHSNILEQYRRRFRFVLIDEFQDTNRLQYDLMKLISMARQAEARSLSITASIP